MRRSVWSDIEIINKDVKELKAALLTAETVEERNEIHLQLMECEEYLGQLYSEANDESSQWSGGDY